uniref:Uncharacterized protein TCIL3000_10_9680 n=1 Tax=Trypanosoma congolense (strain IL3000) TaxID=1068625 RepID=G0UXS3_TRYCI|nr:unnamed protein product [Trypanosoma congolense IL3000]
MGLVNDEDTSCSVTERPQVASPATKCHGDVQSDICSGATSTSAYLNRTVYSFMLDSNTKGTPVDQKSSLRSSFAVPEDGGKELVNTCSSPRSANARKHKNSHKASKTKNTTLSEENKQPSRPKSHRSSNKRGSARGMRPTNQPGTTDPSTPSSTPAPVGTVGSSVGESAIKLPQSFSVSKGPLAVVQVVSHNIADMQGERRSSCTQPSPGALGCSSRVMPLPVTGSDNKEGLSALPAQGVTHTGGSSLEDQQHRSGEMSTGDGVTSFSSIFSSPINGKGAQEESTARSVGTRNGIFSLTFSSLSESFQRTANERERIGSRDRSFSDSHDHIASGELLDGRRLSGGTTLTQNLLICPIFSAEEKERTATVVFDLDETLCNNRVNGSAILRPGAAEILKKLRSLYPRSQLNGTEASAFMSKNASKWNVKNGNSTSEQLHMETSFNNGPLLRLELVLWTASVESVARPVIKRLDPDGSIFDNVICRDTRWYDDSGYTKDLRFLGRYIERIAIVENSPPCVRLNRRNAILVTDFIRNRMDRQLYVVCMVLMEWLSNVSNLLLRKHALRTSQESRNATAHVGKEEPNPDPETGSSTAPSAGTAEATKPTKEGAAAFGGSLREMERMASAVCFIGGHPFISPVTRYVKTSTCQEAVKYLSGEGVAVPKMRRAKRRSGTRRRSSVSKQHKSKPSGDTGLGVAPLTSRS